MTVNQTPVHEHHNPDLLRLIPVHATSLIEVGCSAGAMAREFKKLNPNCRYVGIEIDAQYARLADRYCDETLVANVETLGQEFFADHADCDCWIFGDTLEHLQDPWKTLKLIRGVLPKSGCVVACIPNAQHWSVQVKLNIGQFIYEDSGLLDRTHLRWFTRHTIEDLFADCGFEIVEHQSRIFPEQGRDRFLPLIGQLAEAAGLDATVAIEDALPLQYVVRGVPAPPSTAR